MSGRDDIRRGGADRFARAIAILGLAVAIAAVVVPYFQSEADKREYLTVTAKPEGVGGTIRLSDDESKSRAVQIPWIVTLSNTGRTKLSIVSYAVFKIIEAREGSGREYFPGLDGGTSDRYNKPISFPMTLDAGESASFRLYLGFVPTKEVAEALRAMYKAGGPLDVHKSFLALAEKGLTTYGGKATLDKSHGGTTVTLDSSSQALAPVYNVAFRTGRNQEFSTVISDYPKP